MKSAKSRHHYFKHVKRNRNIICNVWGYNDPCGMGLSITSKWIEDTSRAMVNHRPLCSCEGCGNRRVWEGDTMQEKKSNISYKEQLKEI